MPLVTLKEVLKDSVKNKYAVGAFDTIGSPFTEGILLAAEKKGVPIIIMMVEWLFDDPNYHHFMTYLRTRCQNSSVPVAMHLDHGSSYKAAIQAIHYGCSSVMFDGSALPLEENIARTRQVVEAAHCCGVSVEAEIGHVAGHEGNMAEGNVADESMYTNVDDAVRFLRETDVDALAVAIGTVHGIYRGTPKLDLDRLDQLRERLDVPLVMHGGSGLSPQHYRDAIAHGINKINYFTAMNIGASDAVRALYHAETKKVSYDQVLTAGQNAIQALVEDALDVFGTLPL